MPSLTAKQADAYLERIGARRPARADAEALEQLHEQHLRTVPFENLGIHLGEDVSLGHDRLFDKVVAARRGGFCYELNGLFAALLDALGYRVTLLAARTFGGDGAGWSAPFNHLALRVDLPEPKLLDVGFGRNAVLPLSLDLRGEQSDPGGTFRVAQTPEGDLDLLRDDEPQYRLELRPRALRDFAMGCWWQCTSPQSHFTRSLICSRQTERGRISLSGRQLIRTEAGGRLEERLSDDAVLPAYREHFGIVLDREPVLCGEPPLRRA